MCVLFVPAFNVDGHERFGRWNRPNQSGPEETGWRTTAQNLNLNRDYTKADAPEMQAMLRLHQQLGSADLRRSARDRRRGFRAGHIAPGPSRSTRATRALFASGVQLRDGLIEKLAAQGSIPLPFYPGPRQTDDPASGFQLTVYSPRFSTGYFAGRNRLTVLVETHSWKDYATRVRVSQHMPRSGSWNWRRARKRMACHGAAGAMQRISPVGRSCWIMPPAWREPRAAAWRRGARRGAEDVDMIDFRGYAYTRCSRRFRRSGDGLRSATPQIWRVPLSPQGASVADRKGAAALMSSLRPTPKKSAPGLRCTAFASRAAWMRGWLHPSRPFARRTRDFQPDRSRVVFARASKAPGPRNRATFPRAALIVPVAQPLARLVLALLEPQAPDSFAAWGFFNACLEQKEYFEPYVAEQIAREMLATSAKLAADFKRRLGEDAAFAMDPAARLQFFLRWNLSWDERLDLYPVYRIA